MVNRHHVQEAAAPAIQLLIKLLSESTAGERCEAALAIGDLLLNSHDNRIGAARAGAIKVLVDVFYCFKWLLMDPTVLIVFDSFQIIV